MHANRIQANTSEKAVEESIAIDGPYSSVVSVNETNTEAEKNKNENGKDIHDNNANNGNNGGAAAIDNGINYSTPWYKDSDQPSTPLEQIENS